MKLALETCFPYPVEIVGEVSNYRPHHSGHAYFTLKDPFSQIDAVMWRARVDTLSAPLRNGEQLVCTGTITLYEKTGRYQLNVLNVRPMGQGDLQARFEALKQKLWEQGWFDEARKRPLPVYPRRIGLITSPTGAAVRDLIAVARRRNPSVGLVLRPAQVQGAKAVPELVQALEDLNAWGEVDAIIIGRGGGSLEDLWAFNDEAVARAIYHSRLPVISAVGHEVDVTIADLVADRRAATPSAAAELAVPPLSEMLGQLSWYADRSLMLTQNRLERLQQRLKGHAQHHALQRPRYLLEQKSQLLKQHIHTLQGLARHDLARHSARLEQAEARLEALNPLRVLERGFVHITQQGRLVTHRAQLQPGSTQLHFADGPQTVHLSFDEDPDAQT